MNSPTEEVTEKLSAKSAVDSKVRDLVESTEPAQTEHTKKKIEIDAERIRSSITRLTSNSTDELEKLSSELEKLQEFLKSETERVQHEIWSVLAGIGLIVETIAPWKAPGVSAQSTRANGVSNARDKIKRWP
jgi:light-regulated signal transduction histidine kinase (bacteriophytochrome)